MEIKDFDGPRPKSARGSSEETEQIQTALKDSFAREGALKALPIPKDSDPQKLMTKVRLAAASLPELTARVRLNDDKDTVVFWATEPDVRKGVAKPRETKKPEPQPATPVAKKVVAPRKKAAPKETATPS